MPRQRDDTILRAIGQRIRQHRDQRGLTQAQLAEEAGIEAVTLSRYEVGARSPSVSTLGRIAAALGVRLADIVDTDEPVAPAERRPAEEAIARVLGRMDDSRLRLAAEVVDAIARWPG